MNPDHALYVLELVRARALAELMESQYSVGNQISAVPQSWTDIENIMKKESNRLLVCTFLIVIMICFSGFSRQVESFISED